MDPKIVLISSLPAILFFTGIIFFAYSPLTFSRIITVQNEVFVMFFKVLEDVDLLSALMMSFEYFWTNVLWVVLIFLLLMSFGFLVYLYFFKVVNFRVVVISQVVMIILVLILTNLSITMFLISISLLAGTVWMSKTFEPEKKVFSTGYSVITSKIGLLSIFLGLGILVTLLVNTKNYEKEILEANMGLIKGFMPDMSQAKDAQKNQVEKLTEGIKYALSERYGYLPEETKTECKVLYDGLNQSLDSYKQQSFQKIDEANMTISEEDILQIFPFFGLIVKATPVIIAISAYALLAVLTPIMGIICGFVYSLVKKD
jgi:hypothetical protein